VTPRPARLRWAALLLGLLALAGCWDREEVNDLQVVSGVAFDAAPGGGTQVTVSIVLPQNLPAAGSGGGVGNQSAPTAALLTAEGPTLGEAVERLAQMVPGRLFWGQTRVVIVGEGLARRGIEPVVDFFLRSRTTRLLTDMVVTPGSGAALLAEAPPLRVPATDVLFEHLRRGQDVRAFVYRVAESKLTASDAILLPRVRVVPEAGGDAGGSGQTGGASQAVRVGTFLFGGAGIFRHARLVGWLDERQEVGAMWVLGEWHPEQVVLQAPDGARLGVRIQRAGVRRSARRLPDGRVGVEFRVDVAAAVHEVDRGTPPLADPGYVQALSVALARGIRGDVADALGVLRRQDVDFLGIGRTLAAYQPAAWRRLRDRWPADLDQVPVLVEVRAQLHGTGNLGWLP
jgi:spore germination protein KC